MMNYFVYRLGEAVFLSFSEPNRDHRLPDVSFEEPEENNNSGRLGGWNAQIALKNQNKRDLFHINCPRRLWASIKSSAVKNNALIQLQV